MWAGSVELLVVSVTRLSTGVCVACVTKDGKWIRPTRPTHSGWRQLEIGDLRDMRGRLVVKVGNVVGWRLGPPMRREIHTEDQLLARYRPVFMRRLSSSEFLNCCAKLVSPSLARFLESADRSLALVRPRGIRRVLFEAEGKGGITAMVSFDHAGKLYEFKVTDLAWRALGRRVLAEKEATVVECSGATLAKWLGLEVEYLGIGRGRKFRGEYWPFIITVATKPLNNEPIDYRRT